MNYSITNDKRKTLECYLFLIGCVLCVLIEIFVFPLITINNATLNILFTTLKIAFSISPVLFVIICKKTFNKLLLKMIGIPNLSGEYIVKIDSNYNNGTTSTSKIKIVQTFDKIKMTFMADKSSSNIICCHINNDKINPELIYNYINEGNPIDKKNKTHVGTAFLTFQDKTITGYYFNNGKDRNTYGSIAS